MTVIREVEEPPTVDSTQPDIDNLKQDIELNKEPPQSESDSAGTDRMPECNGDGFGFAPRQDPGDYGIVDTVLGLIKSVVHEMFPFLCSREVFGNSLRMTNKSILNNPCTSIFYTLITLFGVLPILCFLLAILGIFLLGVVWFVFSQVTLFCVAAVVFGGFMFFIVIASLSIACFAGMTIQTVYFWKWMKVYLTDNWRMLLYSLLDLGGKPGEWVKRQVEAQERRSRSN